MRRLLILLLTASAGPAQAMNWEGHDDWMAGMDPALAYEQAVPGALAAREALPPCMPEADRRQDNPYEQIAEPGKDCPPGKEPAVPHP